MSDARVLTVRQPWAWAIVHGGKNIENRTWSTHHRGPLLIHAGSRLDSEALDVVRRLSRRRLPPVELLDRGAIIGVVELVDCVQEADSPWADPGMWHWVLRRPRALDPPFPAAGRLGLWTAPPEVQL